jgi:hypothetical protein
MALKLADAVEVVAGHDVSWLVLDSAVAGLVVPWVGQKFE